MSSSDSKENGALIRVENLTVEFGTHTVLKDVNITVNRGETLVVIGESGCGKTVLLKSIIGLVQPTRGNVVFDGSSLSDLSDRELTEQRLRFGFVFQGAALFDSLNIYENVAFALREHTSYTETQIRDKVKDCLHDVGLSTNIVARKPAQLSGGMRKRVGLARAIALGPEVMLYDEPTTGLDPIMSDVINELIISTRQRAPVTSIVVTHDMKSALKVASRIVMLYPLSRLGEGQPQILYDGDPREIEQAADRNVRQFVRGEAGERLMEMARGEAQGD